MVLYTIFTTLFSALFAVLKTSALLILLNDYFKRTYPEKYETLLVEIPLQMIYIYSKCQIMSGKIQRKVNEFIDANPPIKKFINDIYKCSDTRDLEIEYIVNGDVSGKYKRTQSLPDTRDKANEMLIFSDLSTNEKCVNKKILQPDIDFTYKISSVQFILFEVRFVVKTETKCIVVLLKSDTYNYYIVNNIIDKNFLKYYLKNYASDSVISEEINEINTFHVKVIDNDVNIETFDIKGENCLIVKESEYIIVSE